MLPEEIHGYRIREVIGRGGFAVVYRATSKDGSHVALKVLHPGSSEQLRRRFARGAHSQGILNHEGIVSIHESFRDAIAMDYVSEIDLKKETQKLRVMRRRLLADHDIVLVRAETPLDSKCEGQDGPGRRIRLDASYAQQVARWGLQIADALAGAHAIGIVHRDIKPSNVLINREGNAVVTDFDLAFQIGDDEVLTLTGDSACTLDYCSPEQALRRPVHHSSTDVYSLGVVLYELLTLSLPFEHESDQTNDITKTQDASKSAPRADQRADGVPRVLADVVKRALQKDPRDRYPNATEMAADLRCFLAGGRLRVRRTSPMTKVVRTLGRHKAASFTAIGIGAILLFVLATAWVVAGIGELERLSAASREGDLEAVIATADRIGLPFSLFMPESLSQLPSDSEHPVRQVHRTLRRDVEEGLRLAASFLREDGPAAHPLLVWKFESLVSDPVARGSGLCWIGRALLEAPCNSRAMMEDYDRIRTLCWDILEESLRPTRDQLWSIAIIGACGSESDGKRLAGWLGRSAYVPERSRLGIAALGQIAQRVWSCRGTREPDRRSLARTGVRLRDGLAPVVSGWVASKTRVIENEEKTIRGRWEVFSTAGALHELMCRERVVCEDWSQLGIRNEAVAFLDAVSRDPTNVVQALSVVPPLREDGIITWAWKVAILSKVLVDSDLVTSARRDLSDKAISAGLVASRHGLAWFDEGIDMGRAPWEDRIATRLDPESLLRIRLPRSDAPEVVGCEPMEESSGDANGGEIAGWSFVTGRPLKSGCAGEVETEHARFKVQSSGYSHMRLWTSGRSAIHLPFELEAGFVGGIMLELHHLASVRAQFPYRGEVMIYIALDGVRICEKKVHHACYEPEIVRINEDRLEPGRRVLTISLSTNTTTYRIKKVALRRERK